MKKILFIEAVQYGSYYDERYDYIRGLGYDVFVLYGEGETGDRKPDRHRTAGGRDVAQLIHAAKAWHEEEGFCGISTLAEPSILATAEVAEVLDLSFSSREAAQASRNKHVMRLAHQKGSVAHPAFLGLSEFSDLAQWPDDHFPAIVKPTMGSASWFVFKAKDMDELRHYARIVLDNAPRMVVAELEATGIEQAGPSVIVERYLTGSEHLVEGYVFDGTFVLGSLVDRVTLEGATFDDDVHHAPSGLPQEAVASIFDVVQGAVRAQGIEFAPIHAEVRFERDKPNIVEVAIRPGGGGLNHMAAISYGYDPLKVVAQLALGEDPRHPYEGPGATHTVAACLMGKEGEIRAISGAEEIESHDQVFFFKLIAAAGTVLLRPPNGNSIVGFLGVTGRSYEEAVRNLNAESEILNVELKE